MDGLLRSQTVTSTNNCVQKATMASPLGHDQIKPMMYLCYTTEQTGLRCAEVRLISGLRSFLRYIMTSSCHHDMMQCFSSTLTWKCSPCVGYRRRDYCLGFFLAQVLSCCQSCSSLVMAVCDSHTCTNSQHLIPAFWMCTLYSCGLNSDE